MIDSHSHDLIHVTFQASRDYIIMNFYMQFSNLRFANKR